MKTHSDPQKTSGKSSADNVSGKGASMPAQLQQDLQEMADNSERVRQLKAYQAMADAHISLASKKQPSERGNQKPVLRKKTGSILSPGTTPFAGVVQAKRTRPAADAELTNMIAAEAPFESGIGKKVKTDIPEGEAKKRADAVWGFLDTSYTTTLARGTRLYGELQGKIADYKTRSKKAAMVEDLKKKDAKNEEIFNSSYATDMQEHAPTGKVFMETSGKEPEFKKEDPGFEAYMAMKKKKTRTTDYENTALPAKGQIIANQNFSDNDFAKFQPKGALKNSEILWNQYRMAAKKAATTGTGAEKKVDAGKVAGTLKKLEHITREHIQNEETLATIYLAGANNTKIGAKKEHTPTKDEFLALLGTPNGNSSAYILMDHMHDMEKNIKSITTEGSDTHIDMNIKFKSM